MASFHLWNITTGEGNGRMLWRGISALRIYLDVSDRQCPAVLVPNYLEVEIRWGADCTALIWSTARLVSWFQSCHGLCRQPRLRSVPKTLIHLIVCYIHWPPLIKMMSSPFCTQKDSIWWKRVTPGLPFQDQLKQFEGFLPPKGERNSSLPPLPRPSLPTALRLATLSRLLPPVRQHTTGPPNKRLPWKSWVLFLLS